MPWDSSYWPRMLLIQRWRRIELPICAALALCGLIALLIDPDVQQPPTFMLVGSVFAFIVAVLVAVNVLTISMRK